MSLNQWTYQSLFRKHLELTRCCREDLLTLNENIVHWLFKARINNASDYISAWQLQSDEKYSGYSDDQDIVFESGGLDFHLYTPYEEFIFEIDHEKTEYNPNKLQYFVFRRMFLNPHVHTKWFPNEPIEQFNIYQWVLVYEGGHYVPNYIFPFLDDCKVLFLSSRVSVMLGLEVPMIEITKDHITWNHVGCYSNTATTGVFHVKNVIVTKETRRSDIPFKIQQNLFPEQELSNIKGEGVELCLPCPDYNVVITHNNGVISRRKDSPKPNLRLWKPLQRPELKVFIQKRCTVPSIILISIITLTFILLLLHNLINILWYPNSRPNTIIQGGSGHEDKFQH